MIAEEMRTTDKPADLSEAQGKTLDHIKFCITKAIIPFKNARMKSNIEKRLNEIKLTQIFVEQIGYQLNAFTGIAVNSGYSDLFYGTKGIPDFYFYILEEGKTNLPLFIVESKRLPTPGNKKLREKEYVFGNRKGGIERYKKEIHGRKLNECGMIGFIEKYNSSYWLNIINLWIQDLSRSNPEWNSDEKLTMKVDTIDYSYLVSIAHREKSSKDVLLHHWWII